MSDYLLANSSSQTVLSISSRPGLPRPTAGGPNYGWFPDEDVLGSSRAQMSLTK